MLDNPISVENRIEELELEVKRLKTQYMILSHMLNMIETHLGIQILT